MFRIYVTLQKLPLWILLARCRPGTCQTIFLQFKSSTVQWIICTVSRNICTRDNVVISDGNGVVCPWKRWYMPVAWQRAEGQLIELNNKIYNVIEIILVFLRLDDSDEWCIKYVLEKEKIYVDKNFNLLYPGYFWT